LNEPVLAASVDVAWHIAEIETQILRSLGEIPSFLFFKSLGTKLDGRPSDLVSVQEMHGGSRDREGNKQTAN
jgi:hypothetical protein